MLIIPILAEEVKQSIIPMTNKTNGETIITVALVLFQNIGGWLYLGLR
jgi:hypothetical protein